MRRCVRDAWLAGVCGALARELEVDPRLVRVSFTVALIFDAPLAVITYLLLWLAIPSDARSRSVLAATLDCAGGLATWAGDLYDRWL
jgi:phage shock protein PspC (stress-responsive transcriptional regulator)